MKGFTELASARLHFIEKSDILDRNDCLIRKGLHQFDLARCEQTGFAAREHQSAFDLVIPQERHTKH